MVAALLLVGGLTALVLRNVLASTVVFQSTGAKFSASAIDGNDVALGMTTMRRSNGAGGFTDVRVIRAGFAGARIDGFCMSKTEVVAGVTMSIKLTVGDGVINSFEIQGQNAEFDITQVKGGAAQAGQPAGSSGIQLDGRAQMNLTTADLTTTGDVNPFDAPTTNGGVGWFGIDASEGRLYNVKGVLQNAVIGGPFSLPGLKIVVTPGTVQACDAVAAPLPK
jgi:hypothetical protein